MKRGYVIITNNPIVGGALGGRCEVIYIACTYEDILKKIRDKIHLGYRLMSHPLSGSVKPGETPYKSVMLSADANRVDMKSLSMIESAIQSCAKFNFKQDCYDGKILEDFQQVDLSLIKSGIDSAGIG